MRLRHFLRLIPAIAGVLLALGSGTPAHAQEGHCFDGLRSCFVSAAARDGFWDRWAAGLECEISFADCLRQGIIGH